MRGVRESRICGNSTCANVMHSAPIAAVDFKRGCSRHFGHHRYACSCTTQYRGPMGRRRMDRSCWQYCRLHHTGLQTQFITTSYLTWLVSRGRTTDLGIEVSAVMATSWGTRRMENGIMIALCVHGLRVGTRTLVLIFCLYGPEGGTVLSGGTCVALSCSTLLWRHLRGVVRYGGCCTSALRTTLSYRTGRSITLAI